MKKFKKAAAILLCIILLGGTLFMGMGYFLTKSEIQKAETKTFQTENETFKVAIISDSQLPPTQKQLDEDDTYLKNLINALTVIKNNDVDMILYAGDIGDLVTQ